MLTFHRHSWALPSYDSIEAIAVGADYDICPMKRIEAMMAIAVGADYDIRPR